MSPLTKAFVVLATLLSVVMVSLTVAHVARTENYRAKFNDLKNDRDAAVERSAQALAQKSNELVASRQADAEQESELADVKGDLQDTLGEIRSRDERIASLEANLARMTAANSALSATLTSANDRLSGQDEQIRSLIGETGNLARQKGELEQAIAVAIASRDRYANEVRRLTEALQAEEAQRAAINTDRERLVKLVESLLPNPEDTTLTVSDVPIEGAVTRIDNVSDDLALVGINVGTRDSVQRNMLFTISRGSTYIGTIRITAVDTDEAVGELDINPGGEIRRGDTVYSGPRR